MNLLGRSASLAVVLAVFLLTSMVSAAQPARGCHPAVDASARKAVLEGALARRLTDDVRAIAHDGHLHVDYSFGAAPP